MNSSSNNYQFSQANDFLFVFIHDAEFTYRFTQFKTKYSKKTLIRLFDFRYQFSNKSNLLCFYEKYNYFYLLSIRSWLLFLYSERELLKDPLNFDLVFSDNQKYKKIENSLSEKCYQTTCSFFINLKKLPLIQHQEAFPSELNSVFFALKRMQKKLHYFEKFSNKVNKNNIDSLRVEYSVISDQTLQHFFCRLQFMLFIQKSENFLFLFNYLFDKLLCFDNQLWLNLALLSNVFKRLAKLNLDYYIYQKNNEEI